jgi:hypothetical protein
MSGIQALQNIPFGNLIGGPLIAAVQAQAQAAQTSIEFIESVGFDPPASGSSIRPVKTVMFQYVKTDETGTDRYFNLTVPILAITPIPYLRIDELNIDFTAKLNDLIEATDEVKTVADAAFAAKVGWGWGRASMRASYSRTHNSMTKSTSSAEYTMNVKVRAVQAEVPGGLAKILDIMESVIKEANTNTSPPS